MYKAEVGTKDTFEFEEKNGELWIDGKPVDLDVATLNPSFYHVISKGHSYRVSLMHRNGKRFVFKVNGREYEVDMRDRYDLLLQRLGMDLPGTGLLEDLKAPMPGLVLDIMVKEGDKVQKETPLMVLEAMKMENVLKAQADGSVTGIQVKKKQPVEKNQLLISFGKEKITMNAG